MYGLTKHRFTIESATQEIVLFIKKNTAVWYQCIRDMLTIGLNVLC